MDKMSLNSFLKLTPAYRDYVWGGEKLRPGHYPTAEAWVENPPAAKGGFASEDHRPPVRL